ncbi:MAG: hypothetical protein CVU89_05755 [Firmicutes bacterium HGW-Firmicutes-14]|nr:MAG: hypothetical protein CVU89_05755 [Firmicutes bacterium HGW-Firmicutes-14]
MPMDCKEFEQRKDLYLQGKTTPDENRKIESHLENCSACQGLIDTVLAGNEIKKPFLKEGLGNCDLSEKQQRKILRRAKYKNRFSIAVFLFFLFILFQFAGTFLSGLFFNWGKENSRLFRTLQAANLLTEFTFPNVTMPVIPEPFPATFSQAGWGHSSLEIKPYFAARGSYALQKQIGKESYKIGYLNINHLLSSVGTEWDWENGSYEHFLYFYHPDQVSSLKDIGTDDGLAGFSKETWQAMESLPEGTVAELGVSFRQNFSMEQVYSLLDDYDLDITWFAVSTGQEGTGGQANDIRAPLAPFDGAWGFANMSRNLLSKFNPLEDEDTAAREKYFMDSMKFLVNNEKLAKKLYRGDPKTLHLSERYQYLKKNGIKVYGVVVTGPSKELLRLRELESVHSPALGDVRLWNWFNRSFGGQLY